MSRNDEHALNNARIAAKKALEHIHEVILSRYSQLFPNYVWTDADTAIDLMFAEIRSLQYERDNRPLEWRTVIGKGAPAYEPGFPGWPTTCRSKEDALGEQRRCLAEAKTPSIVEYRVAPGEWKEL